LKKNSRTERIIEWWRPKAGVVFSLLLFYLALWDVPFNVGCPLLFFSVITLTGFGLTGYFLNDWADIPFDKKAGKTNLVDDIRPLFRWPILIALLIVTLFPWIIYFETDNFSFGLIIAQFILLCVYPLPPIRLKNYPIAAIITDSLYAFAVPAILAWHTMDITAAFNRNDGQLFHYFFLLGWMFSMGIRHIINHHVTDRHNDLRTDTPNLTQTFSPLQLRRFLQVIVFPTELFCSILFFAALMNGLETFPWIIISAISILGATHLRSSFPFFSVSFSKTKLDSFNSFYLGLLSAIFLADAELKYLIMLILFIFLFSNTFQHPIFFIILRRSWRWLTDFLTHPFRILSLVFNYGIYYFRKWVLQWNEEKNWGEHYPKHLKDKQLIDRKKRGVIAIFNHNYNKYTETFVASHLKALPYHIISFYGWPSPLHVDKMENLISDEFYLQKSLYSTAQLLNFNAVEKEDAAISKRLIEDEVEVILAEFGTMGARMANVAKQTGIPLVAIFYGYDAWHRSVLTENKEKYAQLFEQAECLIGVSRDICNQLEKLGCPKSKITYLPCSVDLKKFRTIERDFNDPHFLSVGRFCQTKAPQLTILAFSEVLKKIPTAKLTMIGADDGNGVLESCLTLIKSLKIAKNITLVGTKTSDEVLAEMHRASIFVQHSVTTPENGDKEGTPVAIMEAMATGIPVIATNHAGISEMIENGKTGILIPEFEHLAMAEEMVKLHNDKERMMLMGAEAAKSIRSKKLINSHIELLTEIIDARINK